ncbi:MAG: lipoprotein-releasing system ATP-binding protein LolD [Idiomarina sp.]|uniref:Lipoprotein-releasing system ATP-binding protein LolD n=1 Tax=Idiomarina aquatica TaxID=1327752 RepID=A0A4R6PKD1_9GAMM|nr:MULTISPECIES: lipoprotein-releasing ABC transporter ATP-binding protein LolD [Idiomarina]MAK70743.1 lipoprotein-releasing system ATP-binding protein LolD [Idiomarinaceae bacterium]MBL4742073.1 lipoprotein-releasing ABC transporter ATP-binding protein LolD [Idiomarina sp.]MBT41681.1 lipoprotein-releasing system ATP-binding protein LolD [Idiomarina sp.]PHQ77295.1 MAG: lipoprotein-releasing system ATP-binding protein LolD [Idiomarina sp.]TDP38256.1 lipoprotein-releasing system ATP-binding prot
MTKVLLQGQHINKVYDDGSGQVQVLNDVDFTIDAAEMVAIVGASGSGKSTLMHILAGLDRPTSGAVLFDGQDVTRWSASQLAKWRNQNVGFVYQFHHLLPEFNALENVAMPLLIQGRPTAEAKQRATELLERVGLAHRLEHRPAQLSGGERQRVAVARAFANRPKLVIADEPTGNLDGETAEAVYQLMLELNREQGTAFIIVTHDEHLAAQLQRTERLSRGHLVTDIHEDAPC